MELKTINTSVAAFFLNRHNVVRAALYLAIVVLALIPTHNAIAEDNGANATNLIASSGKDFTGDRLVLKSNIYNMVRLYDNSTGWIAMRGTILRVTQDTTVGIGRENLLVVVVTVPCVVEMKDGTTISRRDRIHIGVGGLVDCPTEPDKIQKLVRTGDVYQVNKENLEKYGYFRSGWVYGALLVPYKYYFHDKSFSSATTIGPYIGYGMGGFGADTAFITSVGLSSLTVAKSTGGSDTSTIQGFSFAVGLVGGINKNNNPLRFGVLAGMDWAGSNSAVPYKHEGKAWAAIQIGFSFSE